MRIAIVRGAFISTVGDPLFDGFIAFVLSGALLYCLAATEATANELPQPDHVVVVVFENRSFDQIVDSDQAPFINRIAKSGALFVHAFAVSHPSQPNYFALFSGSTQGVSDNENHTFDAPNLASALASAGKNFVGYIEPGSPRKHNPWESFLNARATERDFNQMPSEFSLLPTVSFVVPRLDHDMHDGSVRRGDNWFRNHLATYAEWAKAHTSLLIITFDEDDDHSDNHIPTVIYGAHVRPRRYDERISHFSVVSTIVAMYRLAPLTEAPAIRSIWD